MFSFSIETIISGIMFFLGVYAVISMKQAAAQSIAAIPTWEDRPAQTLTQRLKSLLPPVTGFLIGVLVLPHLPASYVNSASLGFNIGIAFAILALILQKIRISAS